MQPTHPNIHLNSSDFRAGQSSTAVGASPHPLRRLTDTFSDPRFNLAFGTNFAASWPRQLEQFYVNEGNALRLWDDYAAGRFDPHGDGEPSTSWNAVRQLHVASPSALSSIIRPSLRMSALFCTDLSVLASVAVND